MMQSGRDRGETAAERMLGDANARVRVRTRVERLLSDAKVQAADKEFRLRRCCCLLCSGNVCSLEGKAGGRAWGNGA